MWRASNPVTDAMALWLFGLGLMMWPVAAALTVAAAVVTAPRKGAG
jgi:type IV secretory pathway TrbD component